MKPVQEKPLQINTCSGSRSRQRPASPCERTRASRVGGSGRAAPWPPERWPSSQASWLACVPQLPEPPNAAEDSRRCDPLASVGRSMLPEAQHERRGWGKSPAVQDGESQQKQGSSQCWQRPHPSLLQACTNPQKDQRGTLNACQASAGFLQVPPCLLPRSDAKGWLEQPKSEHSRDSRRPGCWDAARLSRTARGGAVYPPQPTQTARSLFPDRSDSASISRSDLRHRRWSKRIKRRRRQDSPSI